MKNIIAFTLFLIVSLSLFAQEVKKEPIKIGPMIVFSDADYVLTGEIDENHAYTFQINKKSDSGKDSISFTLPYLTLEDFSRNLYAKMGKKDTGWEVGRFNKTHFNNYVFNKLNSDDKDELRKMANSLFLMIITTEKAVENNINKGPLAGTIFFKGAEIPLERLGGNDQTPDFYSIRKTAKKMLKLVKLSADNDKIKGMDSISSKLENESLDSASLMTVKELLLNIEFEDDEKQLKNENGYMIKYELLIQINQRLINLAKIKKSSLLSDSLSIRNSIKLVHEKINFLFDKKNGIELDVSGNGSDSLKEIENQIDIEYKKIGTLKDSLSMSSNKENNKAEKYIKLLKDENEQYKNKIGSGKNFESLKIMPYDIASIQFFRRKISKSLFRNKWQGPKWNHPLSKRLAIKRLMIDIKEKLIRDSSLKKKQLETILDKLKTDSRKLDTVIKNEKDSLKELNNEAYKLEKENGNKKNALDKIADSIKIIDREIEDLLINTTLSNIYVDLYSASELQLRINEETAFIGSRISMTEKRIELTKEQIKKETEESENSIEKYDPLEQELDYLNQELQRFYEINKKFSIIKPSIQELISNRRLLERNYNNSFESYIMINEKKERIKTLIENLNSNIEKYSIQLNTTEKRLLDVKEQLCDGAWANDIRTLKVENVQIEITKGHIENLVVTGNLKDCICEVERKLKLENIYPIGFSRKKDFDFLSNVPLYSKGNGRDRKYRLVIGDLFQYVQEHANGRRDYAPKDMIVNYNPIKDEKTRQVRKLESYKLFELKIFSDFIGFDETNPNGLVQTELDKEIRIVTKRDHLFSSKRVNKSFLGYIRPSVVISKFDQNNRFLPLNQTKEVNENQEVSQDIKFTSTLDLKNYENFNTGFDLNIASIDIPNWKSTFFYDLGFHYGRTSIADTIETIAGNVITKDENNFNITTFQFTPIKLVWKIQNDERYSLKLSWALNRLVARTNEFVQVANNDFFANNPNLETLNSNRNFLGIDYNENWRNYYSNIELLGTFKLNNDSSGDWFFRYRFNWQGSFKNTSFDQVQIGYSTYLMGRYKK